MMSKPCGEDPCDIYCGEVKSNQCCSECEFKDECDMRCTITEPSEGRVC